MENGWWHERPDRLRIASLPFPPWEEIRMQREVLGLDVVGHPLAGYREVPGSTRGNTGKEGP